MSSPTGPDPVVLRSRDFERTAFGPFTRRALRGIGEALFTDPAAGEDPGAPSRFDWLVIEVDALAGAAGGSLRRMLQVTLILLELLPIVIIGRFALASSLSVGERLRYLQKLEARPLRKLALLVVVWKTMLTVVYFEHPDVAPQLGYDGRHDRHTLVRRPRAVGREFL